MSTISDQLDGPSAGIVGEPVDLDTFAAALGGMPADPEHASKVRRMHAEHLQAATNRPPVGPCPSWCDRPAGHDWESYDSGVYFQRTHLVDVGAVQVVTTENTDPECGLTPAAIDCRLESATPSRARQVAADLLATAHLLEPLPVVHCPEAEARGELPLPDVTPPCPPWCIDDAGHEYDSVTDDGTFSRQHVAASFDHVEVYATESNTAGAVTLASPLAWIITDDRPHKDHDAGQLRQIAAEALNAADVLDGLTA